MNRRLFIKSMLATASASLLTPLVGRARPQPAPSVPILSGLQDDPQTQYTQLAYHQRFIVDVGRDHSELHYWRGPSPLKLVTDRNFNDLAYKIAGMMKATNTHACYIGVSGGGITVFEMLQSLRKKDPWFREQLEGRVVYACSDRFMRLSIKMHDDERARYWGLDNRAFHMDYGNALTRRAPIS